MGGGGHENSRFSVNIYSVPLKSCALYFYNHQPTTHQMFPSIVISPPTWYTITQWCMPNFLLIPRTIIHLGVNRSKSKFTQYLGLTFVVSGLKLKKPFISITICCYIDHVTSTNLIDIVDFIALGSEIYFHTLVLKHSNMHISSWR